jgi:hypothetical protein
LDSLNVLEVGVLGPDGCPVDMSGSENNAVGHRNMLFDTEFCGRDRDIRCKVNNRALLHERDRLESIRFGALAKNYFENLVYSDSRNDKIGYLLERTRKEESIGPSAKYSSHPEESTMFIACRVLLSR